MLARGFDRDGKKNPYPEIFVDKIRYGYRAGTLMDTRG